jgi:hypothetical protein
MKDVIKKILFPLFSLFLLYRTFALMRMLLNSQEAAWTASDLFIYAFLLTLFITGVFAFGGFAYPSHKTLPKNY